MDPSFWQIPSEPPPPYEDVEPLAIEGPSGEEEIDEGDLRYQCIPKLTILPNFSY